MTFNLLRIALIKFSLVLYYSIEGNAKRLFVIIFFLLGKGV